MEGYVFNIQRFCTDDGPGIRTTVFLKGCPLRCAWCHNPESHRMHPEILFDEKKCILCGACQTVCKNHKITDGVHVFNRNSCLSCGKCTEICLTGALEICGKKMTDQEVIKIVLRDKPFYQTDGGMTLSGGEPLMQSEFSLSLLKLAKENGIHTAIETSGFCTEDTLSSIAPYTDLFLFDVKATDLETHEKYTGVSDEIIMRNLHFLDSIQKKIILRCPIIPDVNLSEIHISKVLSLANSLHSVLSVEFEPYHPLGVSKSMLLGQKAAYDRGEFLEKEQISNLIDRLKHLIQKPVVIH